MARFSHLELAPADGVMNVRKHWAEVNRAVEALAARAARQPGQVRSQEEKLVGEVRQRGQNLLETWALLVTSTTEEPVKRRYSPFDRDKTGGRPLLFQVLDENAPARNSPEGRFSAPTSMRDVEETAHLWVQKFLGPYDTGPRGSGT